MKLYNTLSRTKEEFKPITPGQVSMYHCGPTVYDYVHIGNLRAYIFADIVRKTFEFLDYEVKQVINITDVGHLTGENLGDADTGEDKIERGAKREHKTVEEIITLYSDAFFDDLKKLNIKTEDTRFPRATEHIPEQIALIKTLEEKGFTYRTSDGIYFDTKKFESYGILAKLDIKNLKEGARIEANPEKKNLTDFALWKFSPEENSRQEKREQEWKSPWGIGFPGWHIECSAMSMKYLGQTFDIHTGGIDHIPVHHENERAQSEAATGKKFVHYWLHENFITIEGKRMGKSEGNLIRLATLPERGISPLAYRLWLLGSHYRTLTNFTWETVMGTEVALEKLYTHFNELSTALADPHTSYMEQFRASLEDDFNTPEALAVMWELLKDASVEDAQKRATLLEFDRVLSLDIKSSGNIPVPEEIKQKLMEREEVRKAGDFKKADMLRRDIEEQGYKVKDTEEGPVVHRV